MEFTPLFRGDSLDGWNIVPRGIRLVEQGSAEFENAWAHKGQWSIRDGVVEGRQDPPGCGLGSYLVSEQSFGDFELMFDAMPDWPADGAI